MNDEQIHSLLYQIEAGKTKRDATYTCCGESFSSLYAFRKHLQLNHPKEMATIFEAALHREAPLQLSKEDVHRLANKGKKKREKALEKKEKKQAAKRNQNAYPTASNGDHFRLIYTPMGNKR